MTKLTKEELDERIANLPWCEEFGVEGIAVEQLIRDCIEAVTPEKKHLAHFGADDFNNAIDTIKQNTKELFDD